MTFISFVFITALIAFISWLKTKDEENSAKGYFLAGRGLTATVIGFSMVLTSLSTEQLVGVNASSYASNFSINSLDSSISNSIMCTCNILTTKIFKRWIYNNTRVFREDMIDKQDK